MSLPLPSTSPPQPSHTAIVASPSTESPRRNTPPVTSSGVCSPSERFFFLRHAIFSASFSPDCGLVWQFMNSHRPFATQSRRSRDVDCCSESSVLCTSFESFASRRTHSDVLDSVAGSTILVPGFCSGFASLEQREATKKEINHSLCCRRRRSSSEQSQESSKYLNQQRTSDSGAAQSRLGPALSRYKHDYKVQRCSRPQPATGALSKIVIPGSTDLAVHPVLE